MREIKTGLLGTALGVTILSLAVCGTARAGEIEGVYFPDAVRVGGDRLPLYGLGLLRYRIFIKAYVAALYLPSEAKPSSVLDDIPKRLELHYFWSIGGEGFGKAADQILEQNLDEPSLARLRERLDRLHALYQDVKDGDRYSLTYLPGVGTELAKNGKPLGTIPGADFAQAYFSIWLGAAPIDDSLKRQLLAGL